MANIMSQLNFKNKPSRNGFDLSKKRAFTARVGELLPVYVKEVLPGDKFEIKQEWFTRTMPVNTAAFTRIREYYDFFFVPNEQLWKYFPQFFSNMPDSPVASSSINDANLICDYHPYLTSRAVYEYLKSIRLKRDILGFKRPYGSGKLLWYLGYGLNFYNFATTVQDGTEDVDINSLTFQYPMNPFPLLAYQKIYNDFYRDQNWEKAQPWTFNVDYVNGSQQAQMQIPTSSIDFDSSTMFDLRYCNWNKDLFTGLLPNAQYGDVAAINFNMLDEKSVNNFILKYGYLSADALSSVETGARPVSINAQKTVGIVPNPGFLSYDTGDPSQSSPKPLKLAISDMDYNRLFSSINSIALRQLEALQKYKEILMSGSQSFNNVVEKLYGVDVDKKLSNNVYWLGGYSDNVDISEVINQSFPSDVQTADIRGKGVGAGRGNIEFDAHDYGDRPGVLMCIYHSLPLLDYSTGGVTKFFSKTNLWDYANPVFDKIGMSPLYLRELTTSNAVADAIKTIDSPGKDVDPDDIILGFAPRYIDYKTDFDEVVGAFCTTLGSWAAPVSNNYIVDYIKSHPFAYSNIDEKFLDYVFLKCNPSVLDSIFMNLAGDTVDSDQLLINCSFDVKSVRNLDVNGLPY